MRIAELNALPSGEREILRRAWRAMKARCYRDDQPYTERYKELGIVVCDEWLASFEAFACHVGPRPTPAHSIERKENNGNYEPGNVRWATAKEQGRNKSNNRRFEFRGESLTIGEWAERTGISFRTLQSRICTRGWTIEKSLMSPLIPREGRVAREEGSGRFVR